jgi:hypothetical protein
VARHLPCGGARYVPACACEKRSGASGRAVISRGEGGPEEEEEEETETNGSRAGVVRCASLEVERVPVVRSSQSSGAHVYLRARVSFGRKIDGALGD